MREQSQLDDMRAAIRGDLERAKARREAEATPPDLESLPEPTTRMKVTLTPPTREPEPEPEPESLRPEVSETERPQTEPEPEQKGFFARLFGG
jgi:hypothetical protein